MFATGEGSCDYFGTQKGKRKEHIGEPLDRAVARNVTALEWWESKESFGALHLLLALHTGAWMKASRQGGLGDTFPRGEAPGARAGQTMHLGSEPVEMASTALR